MSGKIFLETNQCDSVLSNNLLNLKQCLIAVTDIDLTCLTNSNNNNHLTHERFYLCCDIVKESPIQIVNQENRYFPILRPIHLSSMCVHPTQPTPPQTDACLSQTYSFPYYVPARRTEVESFRLYIINGHGEIPSFNNFQLKCTLVYQPRV